jgi:hypothetical protein
MVTYSLKQIVVFLCIFVCTLSYAQDIDKFLYKKRKKMVQPIDITLSEYAGPVPPPLVYETDVHIVLKNKKICLFHKEKAEKKGAEWGKNIDDCITLSENQVKTLAQALLDADFPKWQDKLFTEKEHTAVGLSFNHLTIQWGDKKITFEYFLKDLENETYAKQKTLIAFLKGFYGSLKTK